MSDIFSEFRRNAAISRFLADNRNAFLAQMRHENLGLAHQSRDAISVSRELLRRVVGKWAAKGTGSRLGGPCTPRQEIIFLWLLFR